MNNPATDAEILDPDVTVTVDDRETSWIETAPLNGREVTVCEFNMFQGMRLGQVAAPLLDDLAAAIQRDATGPTLEQLAAAFGRHREIVLELLAISTGEPVDWLAELPDRDGQVLLMTLWQVNQDFFVQRLLTRKLSDWMPRTQAQESEQSPAS